MASTAAVAMQPSPAISGDPPPEQQHKQQQQQQQQEKQQHQPLSEPTSCLNPFDSDCSTLSELSSSDSELSSIGSLSPPMGYMSPASSQSTNDTAIDSIKMLKGRKRDHQEEGKNSKDGEEPVRKKRRSPEPKPRTRQFLDVRIAQNITEQADELALLLKTLRKRRKIVVIAGAGISVSAGIPDFRSSTGLFKSLKNEHKLKGSGKALFDASVYQTDKSTSSFHDMVRNMSSLVSSAKPTPFHRMLERLGEEGRLMRLYTQNVDGIDTSIPSLSTSVPLPPKGPWPRSIQLHGGLEKMVCSKCSALSSFEPELFDGPAPPPCDVCIEADRVRTSHAGKRSHGIGRLRPRMVLYNEHNPDEEAIGSCVSADLRSRPDALIVVGTSMKIPGVRRIVREMCGVVRGRKDGVTIWMNYDDPPPGKDFEWDLVIKGPCDEVANQWNVADLAGKECTNSDVEQAKARVGEITVVVPPSPTENALQLATPDATPKQMPTNAAANVPKISLKLKLNPPNPTGKNGEKKATKAQSAAKKVQAAKKTSVKAAGGKASKPATDTAGAKKTSNPKPKAKAGIKATASVGPVTGGITSHFAIAKSNVKTVDTKKALEGKDPMEPLSASDARVNAPMKVEFADGDKFGFHKIHSDDIPQTPLRVEIPAKRLSEGGDRRSSMETISPTSVPRGMADLLA